MKGKKGAITKKRGGKVKAPRLIRVVADLRKGSLHAKFRSILLCGKHREGRGMGTKKFRTQIKGREALLGIGKREIRRNCGQSVMVCKGGKTKGLSKGLVKGIISLGRRKRTALGGRRKTIYVQGSATSSSGKKKKSSSLA